MAVVCRMDQGGQGWKQLSLGRVVAGIQAEIWGALDSDGGYRVDNGRTWDISLGRIYKVWGWTGHVCIGKIEGESIQVKLVKGLQRAIDY